MSAKENFEMHHSNIKDLFELIDKDVHKEYAHTGGNALSKNGAISGVIMGASGAIIPTYVCYDGR